MASDWRPQVTVFTLVILNPDSRMGLVSRKPTITLLTLGIEIKAKKINLEWNILKIATCILVSMIRTTEPELGGTAIVLQNLCTWDKSKKERGTDSGNWNQTL